MSSTRLHEQDYMKVLAIPSTKRGQPLTSGEMDGKVQRYLGALHAVGAPVKSTIVIDSAKGYEGHIVLTTSLAKLLLFRMGMVYKMHQVQVASYMYHYKV